MSQEKEKNQKAFAALHAHSFYSILQATMSPQRLLEIAKKTGCPAVALTDTGVGYGLVEFVEEAKKIGGIKPIIGVEVAVAKDSRFERRAGLDGHEGYIVLLAKNKIGYKNLLHILSLSALEGFFSQPRADWDLFQNHAEGLIVLTGGTESLLGKSFRDQGEKRAEELFQKIQATFGSGNMFLELVARDFPAQKEFNEFLVRLSQKTQAPLVATSDAHYASPEDEESADTLSCIGKNQIVSDPMRSSTVQKNWFKNWEEMSQTLSYVPEELLESARNNTLAIAESIDFEMIFGQNLLPNFTVRSGETLMSQLRKDCEKNLSLYGSNPSPEILERLSYELEVIGKMGFEAYFLIVADFIQFAKNQGIAVGPGRGSAAGSIVSYLLRITNIDPIKYELLFERFLNPERISMPDIDIDFSDERRSEVLQYVIEKYGTDRVSQVCTFGTLSAKAALKDVGRAMGVPFAEMNAFTKLLPNKPGFTLEEAEKIPDFQTLLKTKSHLKKVYDLACKLEGCVRHVSVHACAVIIGKENLMTTTALQWAPGDEKVKITQFPYQQLDHLGLLKMDFLGLKNLSILEKAVAHIKATEGQEIDLDNIPVDDTKTFQMMSQGETTGVFQFESAGMRRYLKELKPTEFEDLVAMNALYRPGPMEYIPTYISGKHDPKKVKYVHKILEPILRKTYGIAVYQEQVLKIAQVFAGFSLGQADLLRKAIGKKIASILAEQREKFIAGAIKNGHDEKLAVKIFDEVIVPFSGYGFNRSHAVCYARIAYETAYLRANFPVEFMAAMMTTDRGNTDRIVLEMNECQAMKIEVLPPSVNESGTHFTVIFQKTDPEQQALEPVENAKKIRFGLSAIKGLGEETSDRIIAERNARGKFTSLQDFAKRVPQKLLNKKTLEALGFSGAFDDFGDRKAVVDSLDDLAQFAKDFQTKSDAGQMGLFGGSDDSAIEFTLKNSRATKEDILRWEKESLGLFVSDHPLKGLAGYFEKFGKLIGKISEEEDAGKKRTIHGLVTAVRKIVTRTGKNMAILTIEDTSGKIEGAVFPQMYDKIPAKGLEVDAFIRARGKVEERNGEMNFIIDEITVGNLSEVQKNHAFLDEKIPEQESLLIDVPGNALKAQVDSLKKMLLEHKSGDSSGREVEIDFNGQKVKIPFRVSVSNTLLERIGKLWK